VAAIVEEGRVWYLYGVIPQGQSLPADVGGAVEAIVHSSLAALVEPVSAQELAPDTSTAQPELPEWVVRRARRHEAVLAEAAQHGAVVPARLYTLFSDAQAVRLSLATHEEKFLAALDRVRGREEWGLKLFCAEARLRELQVADPQARELEAALAEASPGHAYVLGKQRDARLAAVVAARIEEAIGDVIDVLELKTADLQPLRISLPLTAEPPSGVTMVLNLAALVDLAERPAFHSAVKRLARRWRGEGFTFEMSGPWPPFNFCSNEEEA
jgi:hypothetical protein